MQLIVGRLVTGVGNGLNTSTVPTWQSETAQSHQRGKLVMIEGMLITGGICLSYWIDYGFAFIGENEVAWRFPLAFQIVFAMTIFCTILNLPESPRWLVMKGKHDEAIEVLTYINNRSRDDPRIQTEFEEVLATVEEMSKGSYRSLFEMTDYREFHRVCLAYVNQMFQQISGINLITYYAPILYGQVGLSQGNLPKLLAACNGTEYLLAAFIPIFIIEKVGRRKLMLFGAFGMSASMAVLAGTNWALTHRGNSSAGYTQAAFLFIFNTFFAIGWLGMTWLYPAEIVPLRIRAPTNALATSANWIFNFMVVMITPVAFASIGYQTYISKFKFVRKRANESLLTAQQSSRSSTPSSSPLPISSSPRPVTDPSRRWTTSSRRARTSSTSFQSRSRSHTVTTRTVSSRTSSLPRPAVVAAVSRTLARVGTRRSQSLPTDPRIKGISTNGRACFLTILIESDSIELRA